MLIRSLLRHCQKSLFQPVKARLRTMPILHHGDPELKSIPDTINVTFITKDGEKISVKGKEGERWDS